MMAQNLKAQTFVNATSLGTLTQEDLSSLFGGVINVQYAVSLYKLEYTTNDLRGIPDTASGLLVVPDIPGALFPTLVFQRGTVDNRYDVPSELADFWEGAAIAGGLGYFTIAPDLLGMGESRGFHPYLHADSEASAALDMIFAAQEFAATQGIQLNAQLFIAGYSQGGHSAMALHREIETNYSEAFGLTAAVHMAGPYSLSGVMRDLILSDEPYPFPGFVAYQMLSFNYAYEWYDSLQQIFKPQFIEPMERFFNEEIGFFEMDTLLLIQLRADFGLDLPKLMFQDSLLTAFATDTLHPLNLALRENDVFDWAPQVPTRLLYCMADDRVNFRNSVVADSVMRANGAPDVLAIDVNSLLDHRECIEPAAIVAIIFFESFKVLVPTREVAALQLPVYMYPNPTNTSITLEQVPDNALLQIFDVNGRLVQSEQLHETIPNISVAALTPGMYAVRISTSQGSWTGKLVKQ